MPTNPVLAVTQLGMMLLAFMMIVKGPGQNFPAKKRNRFSMFKSMSTNDKACVESVT